MDAESGRSRGRPDDIESGGGLSEENASSTGTTKSESECPICYEELGSKKRVDVTLTCGHIFHMSCIGSEFNRVNQMRCPYCQTVERSEWSCEMAQQQSTRSAVPRVVGLPFGSKDLEACVCSQCGDDFRSGWRRSIVRLRCRHEFHFECAGRYFNSKGRMQCPTCERVDQRGTWAYMLSADGRRVNSAEYEEESEDGDDDDSVSLPLLRRSDDTPSFWMLYKHSWWNVCRGHVRSEFVSLRLLGLACMLAVAGMVVFAGVGQSSTRLHDARTVPLGVSLRINRAADLPLSLPASLLPSDDASVARASRDVVGASGVAHGDCCTLTAYSIAAIVASAFSGIAVFGLLPALLVVIGAPIFAGIGVWRYYHDLFVWNERELAIEGAAMSFAFVVWMLYLCLSWDGLGLFRRPRQTLRVVYGV